MSVLTGTAAAAVIAATAVGRNARIHVPRTAGSGPRGYGDTMPDRKEIIEVAGRTVTISNPDKVYFPRTGHTKLDLVRYYLSVADGALLGVRGRPMVLKRFVHGAEGEAFFQKRAPANRPDWLDSVVLSFPSGRTAEEIVVSDAAGLAWVVNLGCIDLNPHPIRADDLDHPDELRVDLDPVPGVGWSQIVDVALVARAVLADVGLTGWPKTSGSRGMHVYARIEPRWTFTQVRPPRSRWRARSSGARRCRQPRGGGRKSGTASSSTTTRTPRTGQWPRRIQSGLPRTRGCRRRCTGTRYRAAIRPRSRSTRCRSGTPRSAIRARASTTTVGSLDRLLELAAADEAAGPAGRALAAALRQAGRRGTTGQPSKRRTRRGC